VVTVTLLPAYESRGPATTMKVLVDLMTREIVVCIMYDWLMAESGVDEASQVRGVDRSSVVLLGQRAVTIPSIPRYSDSQDRTLTSLLPTQYSSILLSPNHPSNQLPISLPFKSPSNQTIGSRSGTSDNISRVSTILQLERCNRTRTSKRE
jgi:hypothetical protein